MWVAERSAVSPRDEENAAMAYQKSGRCDTREQAREALKDMIIKEAAGWERMKMDSRRERDALEILANTDLDKIEIEGVRWQIRSF